jgi:uncharacterized protein
MPPPLELHLERLRSWFADCPGAVVALSGGVDSSLVAYLAFEALGPERCLAVISASASLKMKDLEEARAFCDGYGIPLRVIATEELLDPNYFNNPSNRCYFCKQTLYGDLEQIVAERAPAWMLNGTNADDAFDYRPGLQAASEFAVRSPLAECGLTKEDIREVSSELGLACWDKPASPCLSSRIPYGERVTFDKLRRIEAAENLLNELGFPICRVRHAGDTARIEVPPDLIAACLARETELEAKLSALGFAGVEIDREGFVSGKLNRVLQ